MKGTDINGDIHCWPFVSTAVQYWQYLQWCYDIVKPSVSTSAVIPKDTLKTDAKEIAVEEEISRNIMVLWYTEDGKERLDEKVTETFEQLGEKTRIESRRLGKKKSNSDIQPVKVLLSSSSIVQEILANSRKLTVDWQV